MTKKIEYVIPGLPKLMSNARMHWRAKHAELGRWKSVTRNTALMGKLPPSPLTKAHLILTRYAPGVQPDFDNLVSSWKGVIDGLVEAGVIADDKPSVIGSPEFYWERANSKEKRIKIEIWAA